MTVTNFSIPQQYSIDIELRALIKSAGLSLGDRACLALGKRLNLPVLTADKIWTSLSIGIAITLIR